MLLDLCLDTEHSYRREITGRRARNTLSLTCKVNTVRGFTALFNSANKYVVAYADNSRACITEIVTQTKQISKYSYERL